MDRAKAKLAIFTIADRIALLLSLLAVIVSYLVADRVFEGMAHIEDEMAFVWQAQAIARGHLTLPTPPGENSFLVPFVVDYNGQRFGKYPLGWPVLLAIGVRLGIRHLINPLLAGLGLWLTYRLGKKLIGETVGLLAAVLTLTSPFFLMNSSSLLSHPFGLVLSASFVLGWLDAFIPQAGGARAGNAWLYRSGVQDKRWLPTVAAAASLGMLAITRPLTALAVAFPFGLHGLYLLICSDRNTRLRLITLGIIVLAFASLHFAWQYAVTGNPLLNPYTLWWPYDKVGFGPGYGVTESGHDLEYAWINTRYSLWVGYRDLFGWGTISWLFLPFGLIAIRRNRRAWLASSVILCLVVAYMAYWIGSWLVGPRYYYEGLYSLTLLSAVGIAWLAGWRVQPDETGLQQNPSPQQFSLLQRSGWQPVRPLAVTALVVLLLAGNLIYYTPMRLNMLFGLYNVQRSCLQPFQAPAAQELTPALIVVHPIRKWIEYGCLLELEDPLLDSPFIFIISRGPEVDNLVAEQFPDRAVYHYYPDTPNKFYIRPRP